MNIISLSEAKRIRAVLEGRTTEQLISSWEKAEGDLKKLVEEVLKKRQDFLRTS